MKSQATFFNAVLAFLLIPVVLTSSFSVAQVRAAVTESIVVTGNADTVANDGVCTLREAITNANNDNQSGSTDCAAGSGADTITFAGDHTITLTSALPSITGNLIIDGSGRSVTVSGNNATTVFFIQPGAVVTISWLNIINGTADIGGGITNNSGMLTVNHGTINGNHANTAGGGILSFGGSLTVSNSAFSGNSAGANGGGAIVSSGGSLSISDSIFSNNSTTGGGGGIAVLGGTAVVSNSSFNSNSAAGGGGITLVLGITLTISNTTFDGNTATSGDSGGGGILNSSGSLTVDNSTLSGNSAGSGIGGGIMCLGTPLSTCFLAISHSQFSSNSARLGGGIYSMYSELTVSYSTFYSNSTGTDGGGIYSTVGSLAASYSTFSSNTAPSGKGGGIYSFGDFSTLNLTVDKSTFSGNSAGDGGGIYSVSNAQISNSTFGGNVVTNHGGGLASAGILTLTNSTFSGNSAASGGGIYNSYSVIYLLNSLIANSVAGGDCINSSGAFAANTYNLIEDGSCSDGAQGLVTGDPLLRPLGNYSGFTQTFALLPGSPAIDKVSGICPLTDQRGVSRPQGAACDIGAYEMNEQPGPTFVVNTSEDSDDGMCDGFIPGLLDCTLREAINAANNRAGADSIIFAGDYTILLASTLPNLTGELTIDGSGHIVTVSGNHSERGFVIQFGAVVTMSRLSITNTTGEYGAGIYNDGTLLISSSTLSGNSASIRGGGLHNRGVATVANSTFNGNSVYGGSSFGGAISNTASGTLTVNSSTFSSNSAGTRGGGLYNEGIATVSFNTLSGNSAFLGGGLYNSTGSTLHLRGSLIANSLTGGDCSNAGAIATNAGNLIEDNSCGPALSGDPLLAPLDSYGGATQTFALLPGSPAIDAAGDCTPYLDPDQDQRSMPRPQIAACDIGAFETLGFTLTKTGGDNQSTPVQTAFPDPLALRVTSVAGDPVNGGQVILTAPAFGAGLATTPVILTINDDVVSSAVTANGIPGVYGVVASAAGAGEVIFSLTNNLSATATSLTSTPNPSVYGQDVTFTVTVTAADGTPSGSVQFYLGGLALGSPVTLSNGQASLSTTGLAIGTHLITVTYSGDATHSGGNSNQVEQVVITRVYLPILLDGAP